MHIGDGEDRLAVQRWHGSGPEVLFIHGISSSGASWAPVLAELNSWLTPITLDLRGHGMSGRPASGYLYGDYIDGLERVLDALGMDRPIIVGHSLGGIVALWWAARHPDTARAIVVVDSPLRSGEEFRPAFDGWIAQNAMSLEDLTAAYLEKFPDWTEEKALRRAGVMTSTAAAVFSELKSDSMANHDNDRIAELVGITSPVLMVHGDRDLGGMLQPDDLVSFEERLPRVSLVHVPGTGHSLHQEQPAAFAQVLRDYLEGILSEQDQG